MSQSPPAPGSPTSTYMDFSQSYSVFMSLLLDPCNVSPACAQAPPRFLPDVSIAGCSRWGERESGRVTCRSPPPAEDRHDRHSGVRICSYSSGACPAPWLPASSPRRVPPLLPTVLHAPPLSRALTASRLPAQSLNAGGQAPRCSGKSSWAPRCGHDLHGWGQSRTWPGESPGFPFQTHPHCCVDADKLASLGLCVKRTCTFRCLSVECGWQFQGCELLATSPGCPFWGAHSSCEETLLNSKLNSKVWRRAGEAQPGI